MQFPRKCNDCGVWFKGATHKFCPGKIELPPQRTNTAEWAKTLRGSHGWFTIATINRITVQQ